MDGFIDKLAQKFTANDIIKANTVAEAEELKALKRKVEKYENLLSEMNEVNAKNMASAEKISELLENGITVNAPESDQSLNMDELTEEMEILLNKTNDTIHRENVMVYRNVQAVINDGLRKQTKDIVDESINLTKKQFMTVKILGGLILIAVLADIAINICNIFKVF